jgi:hypothetical protein
MAASRRIGMRSGTGTSGGVVITKRERRLFPYTQLNKIKILFN